MRIVAPPGVFRPRSDTWMLAEIVQREVLPGSSVLDLCSGSGALAIAAARGGAGEVTAIDVSRRSVLTIRANALLNGVSVRACAGDLFEPVADRSFDAILANPPYLPSTQELPARGPARAWEGGEDGRSFIDRIIAEAPAHLLPGGTLWMVHSSVCGIDETLSALAEAGLAPSVVERSTGPPGPLLAARDPALDREELVVLSGTHVESPTVAGIR